MKNLKIGVRLGLGFASVLMLLVILTSVAIVKMEIAGGATSHLVNVSYKNVSMVAEWSKIIELNVLRSAAMWKSTDAAESKLLLDEINTDAARSLALQQEIEGSLRNPLVIAEFNKVKQQRSRYVEARSQMLKAKADNDSTAGNASRSGSTPCRTTTCRFTRNWGGRAHATCRCCHCCTASA